MFTVCALCYGDYPNLARRCLESFVDSAPPSLVADIRIGLNAVGSQTREIVHEIASRASVPVYIYSETDGYNVYKYPLMRRMLYARPMHHAESMHSTLADNVMWFDDDSYVLVDKAAVGDWFAQVDKLLTVNDMVGSVYQLNHGFKPSQFAGIESQTWFRGKSIRQPYKPKFCTGGWWAIRSNLLREYDYPFLALKHNGGDSILGEALRQNGKRIANFTKSIAINYDKALGGESKAKRRGVTTPWPWEGWKPGDPVDLSQHDFFHQVHSIGGEKDVART